MKQAGQHRAEPKVQANISRSSRTKMNASLAMVVCFVGFQGIVPQSWESASAVSPDQLRAVSTSSFTSDALVPTGRVGSSLLLPYGLDAFGPGAGTKDGFAWNGPGSDDAADAANGLSVTSVPVATGPVNRPAEGMLFAPLEVLVPTSSFGFRTSPITGQADEFHTGQDYAAPCGTPVYSADAGTVRAVGWHPYGGGNRVEVDHGNGLITSYNHLEAISVKVGETVNGGQPIATIGTTGSSTGCHLHFETILNGEHVDPLRWSLQPTGHTAPMGALKDYSPGAGSASEIPAWAQSSTRSDQPAPAGVSDELVVGATPAPQVPAGQDGAAAGADAAGPAAPGTPAPVTPPRTEGEQNGEKAPNVPGPSPTPPAPTPPAPVETLKPAPAPAPPAPVEKPKPTPTPPDAPTPPAPVETPKPQPTPTPTPTPVPNPTPTPTPVPEETDPVDPADSCDTDPDVPASSASDSAVDGADGAAKVDGADVAPSEGVPAVAATSAVDPSVTSTSSEPAPCDDPEEPTDPEGSSSKAAAEPTPGATPTTSADPAAVPGS